ncbi:MAG: FAD:protein FMN transferase [Hyphomicrobium sp.]|uniref:FAD:protein FMN transferase n=1 Tax=Hyphomicrobium sp. TaxID=82 RepID=UPI001324FAFF|nr:FAD:protein FMN transferase [Hyphomicrobium sp.]KAB2943162.1 MAG: FAD:protein FMN transferase [Hyphomicrobium sp.]MBZ0208788.1 FAD:protein FMN transferase [Hyphomicrobium sp.]
MSLNRSVDRRRFITVLAAGCVAPLVSRGSLASTPTTFEWEGIALGAQARLSLQHHDACAANEAIAACLGEVARLEAIFSLHRPDSALVRLNTAGHLADTPADMRELLSAALGIAALSDGAFDPTVQPLWSLYARHFAEATASADGPSVNAVAAAKRLVDWRAVEINGAEVRLRRQRMAITLNGIAQGYVTDRVAALLRQRGFRHVLVNMGEHLALGPKWTGDAWRVGIADPSAPGTMLAELPLTSGAMATSGGYGFSFDRGRRFPHILDPGTGQTPRQWSSVTVVADTATRADGLSTALYVAPAECAPRLLGTNARAYVVPFGSGAPHWL